MRGFDSLRRWFCVLAGAFAFVVLAAPAQAAYTAALAGNTATFTGTAGFEFMTISNSGGLLSHDQVGGGFNSSFDFNSGVAGDQTLADTAAAHVIVNAGNSTDSVQLGSAGTVFQAAFTVNGEGGVDFLTVPQGTGGADTVTLNGATVTGVASGPVNYTTTGEDQVVVRTAGGNDLIKVDATTATQTIVFGGNDNDTLQIANGAGLFAGGRFRGEAGSDTLDYSAWTTPVSVDLGKTALFTATLNGANQVPPVATAATGYGQVEFTDTTTNMFGYELGVNNGLTDADITDSHIHAGAAGVNGDVIFAIGAGNTWTDPGDPSTFADGLTDPDITEPLLRDGNTYFNIHTTTHGGGEIRGQLTLDPANGYGGPATGVGTVNTSENVIGGAAGDTLKGNPLANSFDGRGGADTLVGGEGADTLTCGEGSDSETSDLSDTLTGCETMVGGSATVTGVDPASPADSLNPKVTGSVSPAGLNVRIYDNSTCSGTPLATGSGANFAGAGIQVTVADGSLTTFYAAAADTANQSACSTTSASYQETAISQPPPPPGGGDPPVGTVSPIKPKASGGGAKITLDTGATATCPATATAACTLTATATAKLPNPPDKRAKTATLGKLTQTVAQGQTSGVVFKLSRKSSKLWRKAGKLKFNFAIELTVPGGDSQTQTATKKLKAPKRK